MDYLKGGKEYKLCQLKITKLQKRPCCCCYFFRFDGPDFKVRIEHMIHSCLACQMYCND